MKMRWNENALRLREDGMEAIEGLLVITLMLFVLFYIWSFGFLMYQNWAVQYVANDTASRIAQTYGYCYSDPVTGFVSQSMRRGLSPYRYNTKEKNTAYSANSTRADRYSKWSLEQVGFSQSRGITIDTEIVDDALGRSHVEVKVTASYEIPFGFAMKYFGQNPYRTFTATGRAVCLDIQHYIFTYETVNSVESTIGFGIDSKTVKAREKIVSMIRTTGQWVENLSAGWTSSAPGSNGGGFRKGQ